MKAGILAIIGSAETYLLAAGAAIGAHALPRPGRIRDAYAGRPDEAAEG
jgi:hypothetical protein